MARDAARMPAGDGDEDADEDGDEDEDARGSV